MATEQGLYAEVFILFQKYLNINEENYNKNGYKFKFQGQSDFDWIEESFSTHIPDLYKKIFQRHDETQD